MENRVFGKTKDGKTVTCYTLKNKNGMEVDGLQGGDAFLLVFFQQLSGNISLM